MSSVLKVDQIQSDTGTVNVASNGALTGRITVGKSTTSITTDGWLLSNTSAHFTMPSGQYFIFNRSDSNAATILDFRSQNSSKGSISYNGTNLSYATGSNVVLNQGGLSFDNGANYLDDYEEGTWTPTVSGRTFTTVFGNYTKIGNMVHIVGTLNGISSSITDPNITGLPFPISNNANLEYGGYIPAFEVAGWSLSSGYYYTYFRCVKGGSSLQALQGSGGQHTSGVVWSSGNVRFSGWYPTDS